MRLARPGRRSVGLRRALTSAVVMMLGFVFGGVIIAGPATASPETGAFGTVQVNAGDWMTANGGGVTVYSNGDTTTISNNYSAPAVGMKWQCVELAQRLYQTKGWSSGTWGVDAWQIYDNAPSLGMQQKTNNGSYLPVPGDMIVHNFSGTAPAGHVAVVDQVVGNKAYVVEQNVATSAQMTAGRASYTLTNGVLNRDQSLGITIRGIVHDPDNHSVNPTQTSATGYAPIAATLGANGLVSTYSRGTSSSLITYWQSTSSAWNGPLSLGGNFTETPAAIDGSVFVRGPNGDLQTYWYNNGWNGPLSLGGNFTGSPAVSSDGGVFVRGPNGDLQAYWYNNGWHGPLSLGGNFTGRPVAIPGSVFVRGPNGDLQTYWYNNGWYGPLSLGGNFTGTPSVVVANGNTAVYVRGVNGDLQTYWTSNGSWNGPLSLGGNFTGSPAAVDGSVFVRGPNGDLQTYWYNNGWYGPLSLGGSFTGAPAAVDGPNGASVYVRGPNGDLQTYWQGTTGAWNGPLSLGGNVIS